MRSKAVWIWNLSAFAVHNCKRKNGRCETKNLYSSCHLHSISAKAITTSYKLATLHCVLSLVIYHLEIVSRYDAKCRTSSNNRFACTWWWIVMMRTTVKCIETKAKEMKPKNSNVNWHRKNGDAMPTKLPKHFIVANVISISVQMPRLRSSPRSKNTKNRRSQWNVNSNRHGEARYSKSNKSIIYNRSTHNVRCAATG